MAWNEPGNDNKDPWGNRNRNRDDGPPDLDEILKNTFGKVFGGGGGSGGSGDGNLGGVPTKRVIGLVFAALVVIYILMGFGIVNEQERAVVLRFGEHVDTRGPGLRWNPPLIDRVFTENVTRVRTWSLGEQMLTRDLNIVDIRLSVQYSIEEARDFILNIRTPEESLRQAANSALRHVVGSTLMHDALTEGRSRVASEVEQRLQSYLNDYTAGIRIERINIEESNPPQELQGAFNDVIRAREDEERFKNEAQAYVNEIIPRARGNAQRMLEEASAYRSEITARAVGEASRFEQLLTEFRVAPEVTRQRLYLETMQDVLSKSSKVLVDVDGGNNLLYLPLDKLMEAHGSASGARQMGGAAELDDLAARVADQLNRGASPAGTRRLREGR